MLTNEEMLGDIIKELRYIRKNQPNGELKRIEKMMGEQGSMLSDLHTKIMDPETGLIVATNKNTEFREMCAPEREELIDQFKGVLRWKRVIEWGLGIVFAAIVGTAIKVLFG